MLPKHMHLGKRWFPKQARGYVCPMSVFAADLCKAYLSWIGKLDSMFVDDAAKVHEQALSEVTPITRGHWRCMYLAHHRLTVQHQYCSVAHAYASSMAGPVPSKYVGLLL